MKKLLFICQLWLAMAAMAAEPSWKEIQAAAQAGDFMQLENWVNESGVNSTTAGNIIIGAACCGDQSMVDRLLALGISPDATNLNGVTPLLIVAQNGQTEMVRHLLQRGAKANTIAFCEAADCKGHTPLIGAVCKEDLQMARMLLEAGADPRAADNAAIQLANTNGDVDLFLLLEQYGAQLTGSTTVSNQTPPAAAFVPLGLTELLPGKANRGIPAGFKSKARLAIIADDNTVPLADLLTVQLTAKPLLELVERQEIARVLSEQKLTRLFAADSANYEEIAGLLHADALLLINERTIGNRKFIESRLIRVTPGLVLDTVYTPSPVASPENWAERMGTRVESQAAKVIQTDAIALSLLNLRTSISSSTSRGLNRTLTVLLNDRLAHQSPFVLLDRDAMDRLVAEDAGGFWTSSFLVDGTLEPALDGSGKFSLAIRFQPTGRGEALTFTITGSQADPSAAIDELLTKINARIAGGMSPVRRNLPDEAQSYFDEAQWAFASEQPALAQNAAETAWALGLRSLPVARLRVLATMRTLRDLHNQPDPDFSASADYLDLGIQGLTIWRDTLQSDLVKERPEDLRQWLELGLEMTDMGVLALIKVPTADEQVQQAERLETLRNLIWTSLEEMRIQSDRLLPDSGIGNTASEKEAAIARLIFPRVARYLPAVRDILGRHFTKDDALTRARIRSDLIVYWSLARVMVQTSRSSSASAILHLPPGDEASRQLANELRNSAAPEDRYVSALLAIWTASRHQEATPADLERLLAGLSDMNKLLAESDEAFRLYWGCFERLDELNGVPFFKINHVFSPDGKREWNQHTPEYTEFRRQLYLRLCATGKMPASGFDKLVSLDQYTPEQKAEVLAAQARLTAASPRRPVIVHGGFVSLSSSETDPRTEDSQQSGDNASMMHVRRLWTPFNLGLDILPEFHIDFSSMIWTEGRIWLHGLTLNKHGEADRHYIFAIEPDSLRTETIPVPESSSGLNSSITVTSNYLIFANQNFLAVQDRATGHWETYKEIHPANFSPLPLMGDSVYLIVREPPGNALIGFNLKSRTVEVIASTRRRPAASPFDDPAIEIQSVQSNETGEIVVAAGSMRQAWSPTSRTWRPLPPEPPSAGHKPKPQPGSREYGRVGTVRKVDGNVVLHFRKEDGVMVDIPVIFDRLAGTFLPESRYGPQQIRPDYCNSLPCGMILEPAFSGSGLWVIPQKEIDDYLRRKVDGARPN